jgi:hypothetical protein
MGIRFAAKLAEEAVISEPVSDRLFPARQCLDACSQCGESNTRTRGDEGRGSIGEEGNCKNLGFVIVVQMIC